MSEGTQSPTPSEAVGAFVFFALPIPSPSEEPHQSEIASLGRSL